MFERAETGVQTFILVWFDDIIVASISMKVTSYVKKALVATFHKVDRGRLHQFLGQRIRWEEGKVAVDQSYYIETRHERFQMEQHKTP